ncbi:MAG: thiamine pyrophosphate-dependent enzyme [Marmoricola sp.]
MTDSPFASAESAKHALRTMWKTRRFEEAVDDLFARGLMHGTMHLSIGQEASATGACMALRDDDAITSTHRGHGHCIGKGADLVRMMAELLAKETGYCRGRGGSMDIADVETGNLGANGIVAGGIPIAAGAALAFQLRGEDRVVALFGDGATNEGAFHEPANLAAIWKLPVIFICENNKYGMSFSTEKALAIEHIAQRAAGYGFPGVIVDGNAVGEVYDAVADAVARARRGEGPTLLCCATYRRRATSPTRTFTAAKTRSLNGAARTPSGGSNTTSSNAGYSPQTRSRKCALATRGSTKRCTRSQFSSRRRPGGPARRSVREGMRSDVMTQRTITYAEAVREAIGQAMEADDRVFMLGEDIGVYGGAFGVSGDLYHRFGPERIRDTPISELGTVGQAVGAALAGMRPIVEIQFSDFTNQAMDQIVNQGSWQISHRVGGAANVPMVLRVPLSRGAPVRQPSTPRAWRLGLPTCLVSKSSCPPLPRTPRASCWLRSMTPTLSSSWSTSCSTAPQDLSLRRRSALHWGSVQYAAKEPTSPSSQPESWFRVPWRQPKP